MSGWRSRIQRRLASLPARTLLVCGPNNKVWRVAAGGFSRGLPTISYWWRNKVDESEFASAIVTELGDRLRYHGATPLSSMHGLRGLLLDYQANIGPICVVLGWVEHFPTFAEDLAACLEPASRFLAFRTESAPPSLMPDFVEVTAASLLRATRSSRETPPQHSTRLSTNPLPLAQDEVTLNIEALHRSKEDVLPLPVTTAVASVTNPIRLIDALESRNSWLAAFEWSCHSDPERVPRIVAEVGHLVFNRGEHEYLLRQISTLPDDIRNHPDVAFWTFAAACTLGKQWQLAPKIRQILASHDAPQLRAIAATALGDPAMLLETSRALTAVSDAVTLRAHGYALRSNGDRKSPVVLFHEAMRLANLEGAHHLVIACGVDLAQEELTKGDYRKSIQWITWSLAEMANRKVVDSARELSALATMGFAHLMLGETSHTGDLLKELDLPDELLQIPGLELLISTLGDLNFLNGQDSEAERFYRMQYEVAPLGHTAQSALDLVGFLLATGRQVEAQDLAEIVFTVSRSSSAHENALGFLVLGMLETWLEKTGATDTLENAVEALIHVGPSFHLAQAVLWLCISHLQNHDTQAVVSKLTEFSDVLEPIGRATWFLLLAKHELASELVSLAEVLRSSIELKVLGTSKIVYRNGETISPSLRSAELLTLLAANPGGISAEKLHLLQYGGAGNSSRTKVAVSRLRRDFLIAYAPYKLIHPHRADFIELMKALSNQELQKAVNLYNGPLLPESDAPGIIEMRLHLEESIRQAVLRSGDVDLLIQLATVLDDDLELWIAARTNLPQTDYRQAAVSARLRRLRSEW